MTSTDAEGQQNSAWMRLTGCYEKVDGKWLITYEHWSMPMDMETGKGLSDLEPE